MHGEAVLWPADVRHGAYTDGSEMRAIVVEFAGPDDGWARGLLDATASAGTGEATPAEGTLSRPARSSGRSRPLVRRTLVGAMPVAAPLRGVKRRARARVTAAVLLLGLATAACASAPVITPSLEPVATATVPVGTSSPSSGPPPHPHRLPRPSRQRPLRRPPDRRGSRPTGRCPSSPASPDSCRRSSPPPSRGCTSRVCKPRSCCRTAPRGAARRAWPTWRPGGR